MKLENVPASWGIWAPTIRYHNGRFYMITTNVADRGHFYVHTDDPAGEWSDPVWPGVKTHDPDIFWDDDGKVYMHAHNADNGITQWELDPRTGSAVTEGRVVWHGYQDRWCEAPHMYKIDGRYYILAAEGGTWKGHMITIARADSPAGPFEGCPHNPIATHRHLVMPQVQTVGHGDLVQAHNVSWWIVFLAVRKVFDCHHLGRETFLAPVTWTDDGWPIIYGNQPIDTVMKPIVFRRIPGSRTLRETTSTVISSGCAGTSGGTSQMRYSRLESAGDG